MCRKNTQGPFRADAETAYSNPKDRRTGSFRAELIRDLRSVLNFKDVDGDRTDL